MGKLLYNHTVRYRLLSILLTLLIIFITSDTYSFGFFAHRKINRMAVFALPTQMISFYKKHIEYITEHAIDPDKRARVIDGEDIKHYIDLEDYGYKPFDSLPNYWNDAVRKYSEDTLIKYGINPWWINKLLYSLQIAFNDEDIEGVLYLSANIGHYIADACTPLHTTKWYDGKTWGQKGIHSFWETRIPELEADNYNYYVFDAKYINEPQMYLWQLVKESNEAVDTIFNIENYLQKNFSNDRKFVFEEKGTIVKKQFSREYVNEFNKLTNSMVERRMLNAVKAIASIWYTAWINAGQPDLSKLDDRKITKTRQKEINNIEKMWKTGKPVSREIIEE